MIDLLLGHTVQMQTMVMMNLSLNLLLLVVVVFVINLPSCSSLCDITAVRRLACARKYQRYTAHGPVWEESQSIAKRAADKAGVIYDSVLETYRVTHTVLEQF